MRAKLGGLDATVLQATESPPRALVVLCHGFGAPGEDLVPMHRELVAADKALADVRFIFPEAPLTLGDLGMDDARAWWMIDMETIMRMQMGDPDSLKAYRKQEPQGMAFARARLTQAVAEALEAAALPASKLVLGGFSQGAMLTCDLALRLDPAPAGLAQLSGTLLIEDQWRALAAKRKGLPVFQSHGREDPLLGFDAAVALKALLEQSGAAHEFHPFTGGHTITPSVVDALAAFLVRCLS